MASRVEPMEPDDLDAVIAIERRSFPTPWTLGMFKDEFQNSHSYLFVSRESIDNSERVKGYICFWHILDEVHILNLAVHPLCRRHGVATDLLLFTFKHGLRRHLNTVFLEVRARNEAAQHLYRKLGFRFIGKRPAYYQDTGEDALLLVRELPRTDERGDISSSPRS